MTNTDTTALDGLDELADEIDAAEKRLTELQRKRKDLRKELAMAVGPLRAYYRDVEAGDIDASPVKEKALRAKLQEAQAKLTPLGSVNLRAPIGSGAEVKLVDPELEGQIEGAKERVEATRAAYRNYRAEHFDDLVVELARLGNELKDRYALAVKYARRGDTEWKALRKRWEPILEVSDFDRRDFPPSPFLEVHSQPLMPRQLREGGPVDGPGVPVKNRFSSRS
jgi:hypothetical protein